MVAEPGFKSCLYGLSGLLALALCPRGDLWVEGQGSNGLGACQAEERPGEAEAGFRLGDRIPLLTGQEE